MMYSLNETQVESALEACIDRSRGKRLELLESFQEQFEQRGSLSPRQMEVLAEIVEEEELWDELD
jgi:hypothetical protein